MGFFGIPNASAQDLATEHFDVDDGLPSLRIDHLRVLENGEIFIGCHGLPSIYDGHKFKTGYPSWLWLWFSAYDSDSTLWYIDSKAQLWKMEGKKAIGHPVNKRLRELLAKERVSPTSIDFDQQNTAYIGFTESSFMLKVFPNGEVEKTPLYDGLPFKAIYVESRSPKSIFAGSTKGGGSSIRRSLFVNGKRLNIKALGGIRKVKCVRHKNTLIVSGDKILYFINDGRVEEIDFGSQITSLFIDRKGKLWITHRNGVVHWDIDSMKLIHKALEGTFTTSVCEDHEGFIWIGSTQGLFKVLNTALVNHYYAGKTSLIKEGSPMPFMHKGQMFLLGRSQVFRYTGSGFKRTEILSNLRLGKGLSKSKKAFWYMNSRGELARVDFQNNLNYFHIDGEKVSGISHICRFRNGVMYFIRDKLLYKIDGDFNVLDTRPASTLGDIASIGFMMTDGDKGFYFIKSSHLFQYHEDGSIDSIKTNIGSVEIENTWGISLYDDVKFIATLAQGLWINKGERYFLLSKHNGLNSNRVYWAIRENDNVLWVATSMGIHRINYRLTDNLEIDKIITIEKQNGLPTSEVKSIQLRRDTLWISTRFGVSTLAIAGYRELHPHIPDATISWMAVNNNRVKDSILKEPQIKLKHFENAISFGFKVTSFQPAKKKKYSYRLLGLDSNWKSTGDTNINFLSLPPGDFCLEVKTNIEGVGTGKKIATKNFSISPAFWQRWYFILFVAAIFQVVIGYIIWRYNKSRRFRLSLERDKLESELKAIKAQFNPHFMFNALGAIMETMSSGKTKLALANLSSLATLLRRMLDSSRKKQSTLPEVEEILRLYLQLESMRRPEQLEYSIEFDDDCVENKELIYLPLAVVQPLVENAVVHGAFKAQDTGVIKITFNMKDDDFVECQIIDNGPGFNPDSLSNTHNHVSLGISLVKEQIELLNKEHTLKMSLEINSEENKHQGTVTTLLIPLIF